MFGKDKKQNKPIDPTVFELELDLKKNPQKKRELSQSMESRMNRLKGILRGGLDKKDYEKLAILLHGYASAIKVINRVN